MGYKKIVKENCVEIVFMNAWNFTSRIYAALPAKLVVKEDNTGNKIATCTQWTYCNTQQQLETFNEELVRYFSIEEWKGLDLLADAMYLSKNLLYALYKALDFIAPSYSLHALLIRASKQKGKNERVIVPITESNITNYVVDNLWDVFTFNAKRVEKIYTSDFEFVNTKKADFSFYPSVELLEKIDKKDDCVFFDVPGTSMHMKAPVFFMEKMREVYSSWQFSPKRIVHS